MKNLGITRNIDMQGRVVIPIELLKVNEINTKVKRAKVELYTQDESIVINLKPESVNINNYMRQLDELGRVVIPSEVRAILGIERGEPVEFLTENNLLYVRSYKNKCVICGEFEQNNLEYHMGKPICKCCLVELRKKR